EEVIPEWESAMRALGERVRAGHDFLWRISQPRREGPRVFHPGGDTHPGKNGPKPADDHRTSDPSGWETEELAGFGVIFRNRPGTDRETYLAFKSGPNRGHFHGDQLSFHYAACATPVAVDHFCSYGPRAGQEHMHNRVAFATDDLPYANMDGYERLIAFQPGETADIAMGQVASDRLRHVTKLPPEDWDRDFPQKSFQTPLTYRRTVVQVTGGEQDYFVIRDQHAGQDLKAIYCLHAYGDKVTRDGNVIDWDGLRLFVAAPRQFDYQRFDWSHENGGGQSTKGVRLKVEAAESEFITVLYPRIPTGEQTDPQQMEYRDSPMPEMEAIPGGVRVGEDEITFDGGIDEDAATSYVTVKRDGRLVAELTGEQIDLTRPQGRVGLFVPNTGYPFGTIPNWLIRQRVNVPDWAREFVGRHWPTRLELERPEED
ncbi:MAG: hypothetical protein ACOC93_00205, partial [Planctomycetota bacterium]